MYGLYCRLNVHVMASNLTVIRELRKRMVKKTLQDRTCRERRHEVYRTILVEHQEAKELYLDVTGARI